MTIGNDLLGEIGVHRGRPHPDQHGEIVHIETLRAPHVERGEGAQALADEMGVHTARGENHRDRGALRTKRFIGEDEMGRPGAHRFLGLAPDAIEGAAEPRFALGDREGAIDPGGRASHIGRHRLELGVRQHRAFELEQVALALVLVEDVAEIAEPRLQRHHPRLAQTVDRRIGDLAEGLAEEMVQAAIAVGEHGERSVITHAAHRLVGLLDHRMEDHFDVLQGEADGELAPAQLLALVTDRLRRIRLDDVVDLADPLDPGAEIMARGEPVLELVIVVEPGVIEIDGDGLAGTDPALFHDLHLIEPHHAGLRAHDEEPVAGDGITERTQPVAVEPGDHPAPIGRGDRRRPVPRLHHRVAIEKHVAMRFGHRRILADRGRDHQRLDHRRVAPGAHQKLEDVVEDRRVRPARLDHRLDVLEIGIEQRRGEPRLVALHPVDVASKRVDLPIVGEHAERLGEPPGGESVGRIALVIDRKTRDEARIEQVGVEFGKALGEEHPLVDDRAGRERAEIELGDLRGDGLLLDAAADDVEIALERIDIDMTRIGDHDLLDLGARGVRLLADRRDVDRHLPPAIDRVAEIEDLALDDLAAALLRGEIGLGQKHLPHRDRARIARRLAAALHRLDEEILRDLDMDPRPVAGLAVGIDRAAVPHRLQGVDRRLHHVAPLLAIERGNETHAARIMLLERHAARGKTLPVGLIGRNEIFRRLAHGHSPHKRIPRASSSAA